MIALVLMVPIGEAELASDLLWTLGAQAIEERRHGADEALVELWTSLGDDAERITATASDAVPERWPWRLAEIDETVVDTWRQHATPIWIDRDLVVVPAWLDHHEVAGDNSDAADVSPTIVRIDPGAAFGLGDHPTTIATARLLRAIERPGTTVLDVGCGSGILSVIAAVDGARRVRAIDIADAAVDATIANAATNDVEELVDVDVAPLSEIDETFDVVLANVLAPAIISMAHDLRRVTARDGSLVVSGLLADRNEHVRAALAPMSVIDEVRVDGWVALHLRH